MIPLVFRNWCALMGAQCLIEFRYRTETVLVEPTYAKLSTSSQEVVLEGTRVDLRGVPTGPTGERFDYRDISRMRGIEAPLGLRGTVVEKVCPSTGTRCCKKTRA